MSKFKDDLYAMFAAHATLTALVGTQMWPVIAPQGTTGAFVVWSRVGGDPLVTMAGPGISRQFVNLQVDCLADDYDTAADIADAVRAAIATGSSAFKGAARPPQDSFEEAAQKFRVIVEATLFHKSS